MNDSAKQNGISYDGLEPGVYAVADSDQALKNLAATGANWVAIIVIQYQPDIDATTIGPTAKTLADNDLIQIIDQAHHLGLKVMLKPHVDVEDETFRGEIGKNFGEADWQAWFDSYRQFITHYAHLAANRQVEQFCVGVELSATAHRQTNWQAIIGEVRTNFPNHPLTYAANQGGEEVNITWWDAVDYIGVDAYYELTAHHNPTLAQLKAAWAGPMATLEGLYKRHKKPIILTEIGYQSSPGTNIRPYDFFCGEVDLEEQKLAYQAVFETIYNQPWLKGFFWYTWTPDPLDGGPYNSDYTPHAKPAEDILRSWYGGGPRGAAYNPQHPPPDEAQALVIYDDALAAGWYNDTQYWGATANLVATDNPFAGTQTIEVTINKEWGAMALGREDGNPIDATPYYWLEFYIRGDANGAQHLWAFFYDANDVELRKRPVDDRYIANGTIEPTWKQVRIPLSDLNAAKKSLSFLVIQDRCGQPYTKFWIDQIRLLGAGKLHTTS